MSLLQENAVSVPPRPDRRNRLRFLLRTLLIAMFIFGLCLTRINSELIRARAVARQFQKIQQLGGNVSTYRRRDLSVVFASTYSPWPDAFIGMEISEASFSRNDCEIVSVSELPDLKSLRITGDVKWSDSVAVHRGIRKLSITGTYSKSIRLEYNYNIINHLPNVEELELRMVSPTQTLIDDLGKRRELRSLVLEFANQRTNDGRWPRDVELVDLRPLTQLENLRHLQLKRVAKGTDWSFLAKLPQLEDVRINPHPWGHIAISARYSPGAVDAWVRENGPVPPTEQTPFHFLSHLHSLKTIKLYGTPAYATDIKRSFANSTVEDMHFDLLPDGISSIRPLRNQTSLKRLHVPVGFFEEDFDAVCKALERLPGVTLSLDENRSPKANSR